MRYLTNVSPSIATVLKPAGLEKSKGLITGILWQGRRPTRAGRTTRDMKDWKAFCDKYLTPTDFVDANASLRLLRRADDGPGAQAMRRRSERATTS